MELGVFVQQFSRQGVLDDQLHHRFFQVGLGDVGVVLGRQNHSIDTHNLAVLVAAGDLALGVRTQPRQQAALAGFGLALNQAVGEGDRRRHQHVGFVAGVAEHQSLVACALVFRLLAVNALGDVDGLFADDVDHTTGVAVVAYFRGGVADVFDHTAYQVFQIDPGAGGDFTADDGHAGLDHGFAGHARVRIVGQDGVQYRIGNLVGQFVRMAFGDRFGGEDVVVRHRCAPLERLQIRTGSVLFDLPAALVVVRAYVKLPTPISKVFDIPVTATGYAASVLFQNSLTCTWNPLRRPINSCSPAVSPASAAQEVSSSGSKPSHRSPQFSLAQSWS